MKVWTLTQVYKPDGPSEFTNDIKTHNIYLFKDLEAAREVIRKDSENGCYGLCECYYNYLVLEERYVHGVESDEAAYDSENWSWQEWYHMPARQEKYEWKKIDQPEFSKGVVGWYS